MQERRATPIDTPISTASARPVFADDRARLARDLHDGLAQDLWLARLSAARLAGNVSLDDAARALCADLIRTLDAGLAETQAAIAAARGEPGTAMTLATQVARRVHDFRDRFGLPIECAIEDGAAVPPRVAVEMQRVLQEALHNVRKHARARRITVRLAYRANAVVLSVTDDGIGFDPSVESVGFGRQSMADRARAIGARLRVVSTDGRGTLVLLRVPVAAREPAA